MKISPREMMLASVTGLVALVGMSYWIIMPKWTEAETMKASQVTVRQRIEMSRQQIKQKAGADKRMESIRAKLSRYPADQDVTADYLKILERLAKAHGVTLIQRKPGKEKRHGDLYELSIDCTWESELEGLTRFLFAWQQEPVTVDIEDITVTVVPGGKNRLKGSFVIICMYTRSGLPPKSDPGIQSSNRADTAGGGGANATPARKKQGKK